MKNIKMSFLLVMIFVVVFWQLVWNPQSGSWDNSYHGQNDTIEYNPYADKWERTQPGAQIQYNPYNDSFESRQPGFTPMFNPFSGKWE